MYLLIAFLPPTLSPWPRAPERPILSTRANYRNRLRLSMAQRAKVCFGLQTLRILRKIVLRAVMLCNALTTEIPRGGRSGSSLGGHHRPPQEWMYGIAATIKSRITTACILPPKLLSASSHLAFRSDDNRIVIKTSCFMRAMYNNV